MTCTEYVGGMYDGNRERKPRSKKGKTSKSKGKYLVEERVSKEERI